MAASMKKFMSKNRNMIYRKGISFIVLMVFCFTVFIPLPAAQAQSIFLPTGLPAPGDMLAVSPAFHPAVMRGIKLIPENPLEFDFIIDPADAHLQGKALEGESTRLIKYFLAALTVPEKDIWVNLSPYEKDRIIPQGFGLTEMGRDLLAQDYLLKQLTASLMYPEDELGKKFWDRVYKRAYELYKTTDIPVNTFNKVWIVPDKAGIYEQGDTAFVVESRLKVMLEEDYKERLKTQDTRLETKHSGSKRTTDDLRLMTEIIREVLIPEIEKEVNEGKNFANLRQIYSSLILATWYKNTLKENLLGQVYVNQNKVKGIDLKDKQAKQKIYEQYLEAFRKGVYNYIKEEYDANRQEMVPRKYFSGGVVFDMAMLAPPSAGLAGADVQTKEGKKLYVYRKGRDTIPEEVQALIQAIPPQQIQVETTLVENLPGPVDARNSDEVLKTLSGISRTAVDVNDNALLVTDDDWAGLKRLKQGSHEQRIINRLHTIARTR